MPLAVSDSGDYWLKAVKFKPRNRFVPVLDCPPNNISLKCPKRPESFLFIAEFWNYFMADNIHAFILEVSCNIFCIIKPLVKFYVVMCEAGNSCIVKIILVVGNCIPVDQIYF